MLQSCKSLAGVSGFLVAASGFLVAASPVKKTCHITGQGMPSRRGSEMAENRRRSLPDKAEMAQHLRIKQTIFFIYHVFKFETTKVSKTPAFLLTLLTFDVCFYLLFTKVSKVSKNACVLLTLVVSNLKTW